MTYDASLPVVAWDWETYPFGPGDMAPRAVCCAFAWRDPDGGGIVTSLLARDEALPQIAELLGRAIAGEIVLAAHNAPFDVAVSIAADGALLPLFFDAYEAGAIHCTQTAEWVIDTAKGLLRTEYDDENAEWRQNKSYALENVARIRLGAAPYKNSCAACGEAVGKKGKIWRCLGCETIFESLTEAQDDGLVTSKRVGYGALDGVPIEEYSAEDAEYPQTDASHTLEICEQQRAEAAGMMPHDPLEAYLAHACRTYLALHLVSCWGQEIDPERVEKLVMAMEAHVESYVPALEAARFPIPTFNKRKGEWIDVMTPLVVRKIRGKDAGKLTEKKRPLQMLVARALIETEQFEKGYPTIEKLVDSPADHLEEDWLTDGGESGVRQISCKALVLKDLAAREYADKGLASLIRKVADFKEGKKLLTSFGKPLEKFGRGPLHSRHGFAETGRTTCSGGGKKRRTGLNYQQLPRKNPKALVETMMRLLGEEIDVRSCFVARPGCVLSSSDFSALEMCTFAQAMVLLIGWSSLAEALTTGVDPHTKFAGDLLGVDYEEALRLVKEKDPEALAMRQRSKVANFGMSGGMGARKFMNYARAQDVRLTLEESKALKEGFLSTWPEVRDYFALMSQECDSGETTLVGLSSRMVRAGCRYTDACNGYFQEHAAFGATSALWRIVRECYDRRAKSPLFGSRVIAFVHDEYVVEHPIAVATEAAERVAEIARETMQAICPDVKIRIEPALMKRWWKAAETVRDEEGRLVPWEPTSKAA